MDMVKKRRVLKKGRIVVTRKGGVVLGLAKTIVETLSPFCRRIKIVGSIRRKEKNPVDIDIVLMPKNLESKEKIEEIMRRKGKFVQGGEKEATFRIEGVKVELYYAAPEDFGAYLLAYSSESGAGIGLRIWAKKRGFKLSQHGLFKKGKRIAGRTEKEIYNSLGKKWKPAERR